MCGPACREELPTWSRSVLTGPRDVVHWTARRCPADREMLSTGPRDVVHWTARCCPPDREMWFTAPRDVVHRTARCGSPDREMWFTGPREVVHRTARSGSPDREMWFTGSRKVVHRIAKSCSPDREKLFTAPRKQETGSLARRSRSLPQANRRAASLRRLGAAADVVTAGSGWKPAASLCCTRAVTQRYSVGTARFGETRS